MAKTNTTNTTCEVTAALPTEYEPRPAEHFHVERIVLCKGSLDTPEREAFVRRICDVLPHAAVEEQLDTPGSRVHIEGQDVMGRLERGKRTLVFDELTKAVHSTRGEPSIPEDYWCFSTHANCFYGCRYCYLAGARSVWFSPAIRVHVNLPEILAQVASVANREGKPTSFYLGRLQDALALDPLIGYSTVLVPFFARHRLARQIMLTKAAQVDNLLGLAHKRHTTLCWSLIPPEIAASLETNVPSVESRIDAMKRCAEAGYRVRARVQPVFPRPEWRKSYVSFVERLVSEVPINRLGIGGVYTNGRVKYLAKRRTADLYDAFRGRCRGNSDGDLYFLSWCERHYGDLVEAATRIRPDLEVGPCHLM
ncbi:MAG: hypothetical protein JXR94_05690 [Candidatus Hydrogenedentes bacterium]|nr:hypothetical protein [Candidatus Hydrogenedentota bacterium]